MHLQKKKEYKAFEFEKVVDKSSGKYVVKKTIGSSNDVSQIERLVIQAQRGKQLRGAVGSQPYSSDGLQSTVKV